jgi:septal ring factor EnvC (AmiA/AmiB activator)
MLHRHLGALALAIGASLAGPPRLFAQRADSVPAPHVMAAVVVNGSRTEHRATATENARLKRDLARYDARIATLEFHLDSLRTYADSLDRDRAHFEAAAAQARARRTLIEQRLRELEARRSPHTDTPVATP